MKNPYVAGKIFWHPDRLATWLRGGDCVPIVVEIDLTNKCNLQCLACVGGRTVRDAELKIDRLKQLLGELRAAGVRGVIFSGGGEPLAHPEAVEAIRATASAGFEVGLITNGTLLTESMMRPLVDACDFIRISLDASDQEMYRYTHGGDLFGRVIENTALLAASRRSQSECNVCVGYLVDGQTARGILASAKLCSELGVDFIQYRPYYHAVGDLVLVQRLAERHKIAQQYETDTYKVFWSAQKYEPLLASGGVPTRPYKKCYGHYLASVVGADGNVYLCCHTRGQEAFSFGSIYDKGFAEVWDSKKRREAIANIDLSMCPPLCRCDSMNRTLWQLRHCPPERGAFV